MPDRSSYTDLLRRLLTGKRVLVVEDEHLVALMLKGMLTTFNATVVGPAGGAAEARRLANEAEIDVAILDINLNGELIYDVADVLRRRGAAIIFATGYAGLDARPERFADVPVAIKPYDLSQLSQAIDQALR
jgi:CheY-like chemotaxis protein